MLKSEYKIYQVKDLYYGKHFFGSQKAHDKLHEHPPTHIAVAYVGRDWDQLIDCSQLKEIIVSPTLGTNPRAVDELVEKFGWEHVHFLDELHAKIYLSIPSNYTWFWSH